MRMEKDSLKRKEAVIKAGFKIDNENEEDERVG